MKKFTKEQLDAYVGRKFIMGKTKYGALNGFTARIIAVEDDEMDNYLVATTYPVEFDYFRDGASDAYGGELGVRFMCLPHQFVGEVTK